MMHIGATTKYPTINNKPAPVFSATVYIHTHTAVYSFFIEKNACAAACELNRIAIFELAGRETCSSIDKQETSPSECLFRRRIYLL